MNPAYPVCEPIDLDNKNLIEFCKKINRGAEPISVPVVKHPLPFANCYWNVESLVKEFGGRMVLGWDLSLWPRSHICAVHHAVYLDTSGTLYDVSKRMDSSPNQSSTIFLQDNYRDININKIPAITPRFFVLDNCAATNEYIQAYNLVNKFEQENSRFLYSIGFRCESNRAIATAKPLPPTEIPEVYAEDFYQITNHLNLARKLLELKNRALRAHTGHLPEELDL
ncbi:TPA: hypothetical protein NPW46_002172 [Klebsiella pneumoniae]|nr:hypothetical protein [Klebsiella pneumoniae]